MSESIPSTYSRWGRKIGTFALLQIFVQIISALTGILIVRDLPPEQYAWLTIVTSMNAAFLVLTEPVTSTGVQALGGTVRRDLPALSSVVATALRLRWQWLGWSALLLLPWTLFLLKNSGATLVQSMLICLAGLLALPAITGVLIYGVAPKLEARMAPIQWSELAGAFSRAALSALALMAGKAAVLVMMASSAAQWSQLWLLRKFTQESLIKDAPVSSLYEEKLSASIKSMALYTLFLCFQAQAGIWLLGVFGNVSNVAELGALARLGVLLAPFGALSQHLLVPTLARCESLQRLRSMALLLLAVSLGLGGGIFIVCKLFPKPFLWVLGSSYSHLTNELPLAMALASLTTLNIILWWFNTARSWTDLSKWVPVVTLILLAILAWTMRPSTLYAVLVFQIIGQLPSSAIGLYQAVRGLRIS